MSSQQCWRNGRPPPVPDPRRRTSSPLDTDYDYDKLYELQRQTAALNARLAAFTDRSTHMIAENRHCHMNPPYSDRSTVFSQLPAPVQQTYRKKQNPLRKVQNTVTMPSRTERTETKYTHLGMRQHRTAGTIHPNTFTKERSAKVSKPTTQHGIGS